MISLNDMKKNLTAVELLDNEGNRFIPVREINSDHIRRRLLEIESGLGGKFPDDYRDFLIKIDGGVPRVGFNSGDDQSNIPCITMFYGVDRNSMDVCNDTRIEVLNKWNQSTRPDELFEIAVDEYGNSYCIAISGISKGCIFYFDHRKFSPTFLKSNSDKWLSCAKTDESFSALCRRFLKGFQ